jgi:hypothetical protein
VIVFLGFLEQRYHFRPRLQPVHGLWGLAFLSCATISNSKRLVAGPSRDANYLAQLGDRVALDKLQTLDTVRIIEGKS